MSCVILVRTGVGDTWEMFCLKHFSFLPGFHWSFIDQSVSDKLSSIKRVEYKIRLRWWPAIPSHHCTLALLMDVYHSLSECGFQVPKRHQAPAHIWDLPRWWKSLLLMYKIFDMRTFRLSHQIKGPTTLKLAILQLEPIGASFSHFYSCRSFNLMW